MIKLWPRLLPAHHVNNFYFSCLEKHSKMDDMWLISFCNITVVFNFVGKTSAFENSANPDKAVSRG